MEENKIKVFVTYRWESEEHNEKVISFTDYLRQKGYNAVNDAYLSQEDTAIDFAKMMHKGLTENDKVIIVLSEGYAQRATDFEGGVGTEYNMIIKEIDAIRNKYILVSFNGVRDSIFPLFLKGKNCLDLEGMKDMEKLFSSLNNEKIREFSEIASKAPAIKPKPIPNFEDLMSNSNKTNNHSVITNTDKILFDKIENELKSDEKVEYIRSFGFDRSYDAIMINSLDEFVDKMKTDNFKFNNNEIEGLSIKFRNSIDEFTDNVIIVHDRCRVLNVSTCSFVGSELLSNLNQSIVNVTSSYRNFVRKGRLLLG